jgi:hypothetical protein
MISKKETDNLFKTEYKGLPLIFVAPDDFHSPDVDVVKDHMKLYNIHGDIPVI